MGRQGSSRCCWRCHSGIVAASDHRRIGRGASGFARQQGIDHTGWIGTPTTALRKDRAGPSTVVKQGNVWYGHALLEGWLSKEKSWMDARFYNSDEIDI